MAVREKIWDLFTIFWAGFRTRPERQIGAVSRGTHSPQSYVGFAHFVVARRKRYPSVGRRPSLPRTSQLLAVQEIIARDRMHFHAENAEYAEAPGY